MNSFKIGDVVRIKGTARCWDGNVGPIIDTWETDEFGTRYRIVVDGMGIGFGADELELIERPDNEPLPLPG